MRSGLVRGLDVLGTRSADGFFDGFLEGLLEFQETEEDRLCTPSSLCADDSRADPPHGDRSQAEMESPELGRDGTPSTFTNVNSEAHPHLQELPSPSQVGA